MSIVQIQEAWLKHLQPEFEKPYMQQLRQFLRLEKDNKRIIYPPSNHWFEALNATAIDDVKVVILGQDPYHGLGQAHGLCFSVKPDVPIPPSLLNIYKELNSDLGMPPPNHGYLMPWAQQGVFLLNATLTVEMNKAGSHQNKGWEILTDHIIQLVSQHCNHVVFMLWGRFAQNKSVLIDSSKHFILKAPHPSPLSAHRGFLGCGHFSKANRYLQENQRQPIEWDLLNL